MQLSCGAKDSAILQVGLASPLELVPLSSFSVTVDKNVNTLVWSRIRDVSRATDHVIRFPRPSPPFLHTASKRTGGVEGLGTRLVCSSVYS